MYKMKMFLIQHRVNGVIHTVYQEGINANDAQQHMIDRYETAEKAVGTIINIINLGEWDGLGELDSCD